MGNETEPGADVAGVAPDDTVTDTSVPVDGIEIDITDSLTETQITDLFAAFNDEDWAEVDRLTEEYEKTGAYTEGKAGGADRNRGGAEKLRRYWTVGEGAAKIRWGTPGDWTRCVEHLSKYLGPRAKGYCSLRHKERNGYYPGSRLNKSEPNDIAPEDNYHETKDDAGEPMVEFKTMGLKGMDVVSADEGIVETIVSVTGIVDNVKDRIMPGAYAKTLAKRKPKGVWGHDWESPISRTLDAKELLPGDPELPKTMPDGEPWPADAGALKVKTQFNLETQRGREAYSDVVFFGADAEWSIGYNVPVGGAKVDQKSGVREIGYLDLYEYSPVLFGAMPLARTTSVKEAQLAYKALKGGASWLSGTDEVKEYTTQPTVLEQEIGDDLGGGSHELAADQMILVKRAIATLSDLLAVVQGEVEMKVDDEEEADDIVEEQDEPEDYDTLVGALEDMIDSEDLGSLVEAAAPVDEAIDNDDPEGLDQAATAFLDVVEAEMGKDTADAPLLKTIATMFADMIDNLPGEEPPSEDTQEEKTSISSSTVQDGNVVLNAEEIAAFVQDFNAK